MAASHFSRFHPLSASAMLTFLVLAAILAPALSWRLPHIVGGQDAQVGAYPWQASLQQFNSHICGGALISQDWVVTAAHCVGNNPTYYSIVLGMHDRVTQAEGEPTRYQITSFTKHPDWNNSGFRGFPNDIALIRLSSSANLASSYIDTVVMANDGDDFIGSDCVITGWGRLSGSGSSPNILQEAPVDVYSSEACMEIWGTIAIGPYHICVGDKGQAGACSGDSGGPLVCNTPSGVRLAGVTSWGRSDCSVQYPSVYTRISYFREWIRTNSGV